MMDIVFICNQIKYDILTTCGQTGLRAYNLLTDTTLYSIGYNDDDELCRKLEYKLQLVAEQYKTGKNIYEGAVSKDSTVLQCIQLVIV